MAGDVRAMRVDHSAHPVNQSPTAELNRRHVTPATRVMDNVGPITAR